MGKQDINLDLLAAKEINKILLSKSPSAKSLASHYWNIKRDVSFLDAVKGRTIKDKLNNLFISVEGRLDKKTVTEIKNNYPQEVIEEIYHALHYFDRVLSVKPLVNIMAYSVDMAKAEALIDEIGKGSPMGQILGSGVEITAKTLGISRVPAVKGQGIPAHSARSMKGWGVTYATSPQGADHIAGNWAPGSQEELPPAWSRTPP